MMTYSFYLRNVILAHISVFLIIALSNNVSYAKETTSKIVSLFPLNSTTDIIRFDCSSKNDVIWALALPYDLSQNSNPKGNYSVLRIDQNNKISSYNITIPAGTKATPFFAKTEIRFFRLINDRYLNIGIKHLDGTIYFVQFDTQHPEKKQHTIKIDLNGDEYASDVFLARDGFLRLVGFENKLPYVITLGKNGKTINEKKGFGRTNEGVLVSSALLNNGYMMLAFNVNSGPHTGTNSLVILDEKGVLLKEKKIQGLVAKILPSGDDSAIIIIAHDNQGKDMEAQVLDSYLNLQDRFPVPSFLDLFVASGFLLALNENTLLSIQTDKSMELKSFTKLTTYSFSGEEEQLLIKNPQPGKQGAYNTSAQLHDGKVYIGTSILTTEGENKGKKTYQINTVQIN